MVQPQSLTLLTEDEDEALARCEQTIAEGLQTFYAVGNALAEIRDERLYRVSHRVFEDYCQERWGMTRMRASQLIAAATVMDNVNNCLQPPSNEAQTRPLTGLEPEQQREVWQHAVDTAPNGKITAAHVEQVREQLAPRAVQVAPAPENADLIGDGVDDTWDVPMGPAQVADLEAGLIPGRIVFDDMASRPMKPKINRAGNLYQPQGFDACQTPPQAVTPLLSYLSADWAIWEPACGEGMIVGALDDAGHEVIGSDILQGCNFFEHEPESWDCLITNPPYSIKYQWLERCYQLGKPFALLLPVETLGAQRAQALFIEHGVQIILFDKRINFKMPNVGWEGSSAQFPTAWFTWGLNLDTQIVFAKLNGDDL